VVKVQYGDIPDAEQAKPSLIAAVNRAFSDDA
jgi:hypothetical protein